VTANNCLLANVSYLLDGSSQSGPATMFLTQCTVTNATKLIGPGTALSVNVVAKNSIFSDVDAWGISGYYSMSGSYNGFHQVPSTFGNNNPPLQSAAPFQAGGAGHYYLKGDSPFRGAGTTTVGATLLNQLKTRTTQPPIEFPRWMQVSGELTLFPQIPRYVSGPPDLGYWYDALDYTVAAMVLDGGSITVQPGAAVAIRNDSYIWYDEFQTPWQAFTTWGFMMWNGSSFSSQGFPQSPNTFTTVELVQDGIPVPSGLPFGKWLGVPCRAELFMIAGNEPEPALSFRFSNFSLPSQWCYHFITGYDSRPQYVTWINTSSLGLSLRDCNFTGGSIDVGYAGWIPDADPPAQYPGVAHLDWQNNVFDRVTLNLNPASDPTAPSVDFVFQARNNLFRGSKETRIIPVVSTAGNWVFKDNLFDKVAFLQDTTNPLDQDFNAYWKRLPEELEPWETDRLWPDASNDRVLASAPVYQPGPLGDYYLAISSPLFNSGNRGSRSVTDAGLYHYTMKTTQEKDGVLGGNVVIGRHYVATTSSSTNRPKDSETPTVDGVPDYVEDANGNGQWDEGMETKTNDAYTETGVHDSVNTVYNNIDLDGDGLPGAAERTLSTDPLVGYNPLAGSSLVVPGTVSALVTIPLSIAPSAGDAMFIAFTVNGQPTAARVHKVDGNWLAEWDTTLLLNGDYYVALEVQADGQSSSVACPGKMVTVQNAIWFPDDALTVGDELNINSQTIHANGTWTMDIYDDQGVLFTSLSGNVDADGFCVDPATGNPGVRVSILDGQGNQLPSEYYDIHVAAAAPAGGGGQEASSTTRRYVERPWNNYRPGKWVIAYQPLYTDEGNEAQKSIMNLAVGYVYANVVAGGSYQPYGVGAVMDTPGPAAGGNYQLMRLWDDTDVWSRFKDVIGTSQQQLDVRNLFYFGHCMPSLGRGNLGGNPNSALSTDAVRLEGRLKNTRMWDIGSANAHPYRFVFICDCSSAKTDLPLAFGIPKVKMSSAEWTEKYKLPTRAFLGFNGDIPTGGVLGQPRVVMDPALQTFLTNFWNTWVLPDANGQYRTLQQAVDKATKTANKGNINTLFGYGLKPQIYGCSDLLFDQN
jgi:hypothetical protein